MAATWVATEVNGAPAGPPVNPVKQFGAARRQLIGLTLKPGALTLAA
jgi:hypothetical protein